AAINDPASELAKLEATTEDDGALVDEVFLRTLNRAPTEEERQEALALLAEPSDEGPHVAAALDAKRAELEANFETWRAANRPVRWQSLAPLDAVASMGASLSIEA